MQHTYFKVGLNRIHKSVAESKETNVVKKETTHSFEQTKSLYISSCVLNLSGSDLGVLLHCLTTTQLLERQRGKKKKKGACYILCCLENFLIGSSSFSGAFKEEEDWCLYCNFCRKRDEVILWVGTELREKCICD